MKCQKWIGTVYFGVILYALLHIAIHVGVEMYINRHDSHAVEEWRQFLNEPVDFPVKDGDLVEINGTLKATLLNAQNLLKQCGTTEKTQTGKPLLKHYIIHLLCSPQPPSSDHQITKVIADHEEYIAALEKVAGRIQHECIENNVLHFSDLQNYLDIHFAVHLLCCKGDQLVKNNKYEEAIETIENALWIVLGFVPQTSDDFYGWLSARDRIAGSYETIALLACNCHTKQRILEVLLKMDQFYDPRIAEIAIPLSFAVTAKNSDSPISIQQDMDGKTGADYRDIIVAQRYPPMGVLPALIGIFDSILYDCPDKAFRTYAQELVRPILLTNDIEELLYFDWWRCSGPFLFMKKEEKITKRFNDLKIELASELGVPAAGSNDLQTPWGAFC